MNTKQPEPDYAFVIFASVIFAPVGLLALIMGVDQIHDWLCQAFGWQEWR